MATRRTTTSKSSADPTPGTAPRASKGRAVGANTAAGRPSAEEISKRAFQIWEQTGRAQGRDVENWLQAEAELRGG